MMTRLVGSVFAVCSMFVLCCGMSIEMPKTPDTKDAKQSAMADATKNVEKFCTFLTEKFGGFDILGGDDEELANTIAQFISENGYQNFIESGSKKDHAGRSPLAVAAQYGRLSLVRSFLLLGADVNEIDNGGRTPLHRALLGTGDIVDDVIPVLMLLIAYNADPSLSDKSHKTPAQCASEHGLKDAAVYLNEQAKIAKQKHELVTDERSVLIERLLSPIKINVNI